MVRWSIFYDAILASDSYICINIECWLATAGHIADSLNANGSWCQNWLCCFIFVCLFSIFGLYPFTPSEVTNFFLVRDSEPTIYVPGKAGHQYVILAR